MKKDYDFSHIEISENEEKRCIDAGVKDNDVYNFIKTKCDHQAVMPPNYKASARFFSLQPLSARGGVYFRDLCHCDAAFIIHPCVV
ncbi:MAG: hypothetical protein ACXIU5_16905 [Halomonadaceae bacterium]|jgi:hypothetical protein